MAPAKLSVRRWSFHFSVEREPSEKSEPEEKPEFDLKRSDVGLIVCVPLQDCRYARYLLVCQPEITGHRVVPCMSAS